MKSNGSLEAELDKAPVASESLRRSVHSPQEDNGSIDEKPSPKRSIQLGKVAVGH